MVANYHVAVGDQNSLGQYLVDRTVSADKRPHLRIACIHCGHRISSPPTINFHNCKCPACQGGNGHHLI